MISSLRMATATWPHSRRGGGSVVLPPNWLAALNIYLTERLAVPGGCFLGRLKQDHSVWPAIVYWQVSSIEDRFWGTGPIQRARLQFDIVGEESTDVIPLGEELSRAMRAIKRPNRLKFAGGEVARSDLIIGRLDDDPEMLGSDGWPLWVNRIDYRFEVQFYSE